MYPDSFAPVKGIFVKNIAESLDQLEIEVEVVALKNSSGLLGLLRNYLHFYFMVLRRMFAYSADLIYVHYTSHCAPPILLAKVLGVSTPVVSHSHGSDVFPEVETATWYAAFKKFLSRRLLNVSAKVVVPSATFREELSAHYRLDPSLIFVSPSGGVDLSVFSPGPQTDLVQPVPALGFVGRLIEEKGVEDFLTLLRNLRGKGSNVSAIMIGDGPMRARVEDQARKLNIEFVPRVPQHELPALYRRMSLFVFPSRRKGESLGLVGLEAMACGVPVLAYTGTGSMSYIQHGENGYLVPQSDVNGMTKSAITCLEAPEALRQDMRCRALATAGEYDSRKVATDLAALLEDAAC
jgi:glycosyltransferase involved in cell wall biosynthesis